MKPLFILFLFAACDQAHTRSVSILKNTADTFVIPDGEHFDSLVKIEGDTSQYTEFKITNRGDSVVINNKKQ